MKTLPNDPAKAGKLASMLQHVGPEGRYAVFAIHTRFDAVEFMVEDNEVLCPETELPAIIRQAPTYEEAVRGLS